MRSISITLLLAFVSVFAFSSGVCAQTGKYVEVKVGYTNIYKQLDPKSEIIKQAKKGDRLELVFDGTSWYQVKINKSVGWIEKRSGEIVNSPRSTPFIPIIVTLILIGGITGGVVYYTKNNAINS